MFHDCVCLHWSKSINFNCLKQIRNQEMEHLLKELVRFYVSLWQVRGISPGINDEEMRVIMIMKPNIIFLWILNIYWILKAERPWWKAKSYSSQCTHLFSWSSVLKKERSRKLQFSRICDNFFLILKEISKQDWINSIYFSSLLRRITVLEVLLDLILLFQGYEVDLNGALYNEQHAREINISLSGQGWPQLQYFKSERNVYLHRFILASIQIK